MERRTLRARVLAVVLSALLTLTSCATTQHKPLQPGPNGMPAPTGFNQYSVDQEIQIGQQAATEADRELPELPASDPVAQYVSTLGQRLAAQLPTPPKYPFNFKVVNVKEINAFALPGGPVRVFTGTIQAAETEDQLAGVIAHEIAHVYMRHATRNASKQAMLQLPAEILGSILGGGAAGQIGRIGLSLGLGGLFMKYSRDAESEADYVGAKIMYDAGYDPHGMVQFFHTLEEKGGSSRGGPQFLSDHPNPGNRAEAVSQAIANLPAKNLRHNTAAFQQVQARAAKLNPKSMEEVARAAEQRRPSAAQVSMQDIMPSGDFQPLQNNAFQMVYPSNWQVFGAQNSGVVIAPRAGVAQNAIAYGVMISAYQPQNAQNLNQATGELYQLLRQANPELQQASAPQAVRVGDRMGEAVYLRSASPLQTSGGEPAVERDLLVTVPRSDGTVLYLIFIAPDQHFDQLSPAFQQMLSSLRVA